MPPEATAPIANRVMLERLVDDLAELEEALVHLVLLVRQLSRFAGEATALDKLVDV